MGTKKNESEKILKTFSASNKIVLRTFFQIKAEERELQKSQNVFKIMSNPARIFLFH